MNEGELDSLIDGYFRWLKDNTFIRRVGSGWSEIVTPYLDRHNDCLVIYARKDGDTILLTDDGYILDDLEMCGCSMDSEKRQMLLRSTLNGFGVGMKDNRLFVEAGAGNFPARKHDLIQAMLSVGDIFYTASPASQNLFVDDVVSWFDELDVRYSKDIKLAGKSGLDNKFDFLIPRSRSNRERLVLTMSNPNNDSVKNVIFRWVDSKEIRGGDSMLLVLMNDMGRDVTGAMTTGLMRYDISPISWSRKEEYRSLVAG